MSLTLRYLLLAAGLAVLAVLRGVEGSPAWAAVFALAAVVNVGLALAPVRQGRARPVPEQPSTDPDRVRASGDVHARRARTWTVLAVGCLATGALLVPLVPAFAVTAGVFALVSLRAARRSRRSAGILHAATAA